MDLLITGLDCWSNWSFSSAIRRGWLARNLLGIGPMQKNISCHGSATPPAPVGLPQAHLACLASTTLSFVYSIQKQPLKERYIILMDRLIFFNTNINSEPGVVVLFCLYQTLLSSGGWSLF